MCSKFPAPVLFGGTFDPFTPAHDYIVRHLAQDCKYHVYVIPTIVNYHRAGKNPWLPYDLRIECINWILGDVHYGWEIWDGEIRLSRTAGKSTLEDRRFIHTLDDFRKKTGYEKPLVVLGTDSYNNLRTWHRWRDIVDRSRLVVVPGRDSEPLRIQPEVPVYIGMNPLPPEIANISASKIRESLGVSESDEFCDKMGQLRKYLKLFEEYKAKTKSIQDLGWCQSAL